MADTTISDLARANPSPGHLLPYSTGSDTLATPVSALFQGSSSFYLVNSSNPTIWASTNISLNSQSVYIQANTTSLENRFGSYTNHPLSLVTNNTERMRIDTAGNINITGGLTLKNVPVAVPVGAVFYMATSTTPSGYLVCNGDTVPNGNGVVQGITYNFSALFTLLGTTYGVAGKLPDLRGEFLRGWDNSRGVDTDRAFGSYQKSTVMAFNTPSSENYVHSIAAGSSPSDGRTLIGLDTAAKSDYAGTISTAGPGNVANGGDWINDGSWGGGAIRPRNLAMLPVIKY